MYKSKVDALSTSPIFDRHCLLRLMDENNFYNIIAIIFIFLVVITFFFSSTIIIIITYNWHSRCRSIRNLLACNSCAVLLFHIIVLSIQIPYLFETKSININHMNTTFCKIRGFLYLCSCSALVNSYLIQAISRYFVTIHYQRKILLTFRTNIIMIVLNWLISIIAPSILFFYPLAYQYEIESRLCILTSKIFSISFTTLMIFFVIPTNIIISLYGFILWHTIRHNRGNPNHFLAIKTKRNIRVYQNILVLLINMIIGGTSYLLLTIINNITEAPRPFYLISILFLSSSVSIESLIIFFTNKDVKAIFFTTIGYRQKVKTPLQQHIATIRMNQIIHTHLNKINKNQVLPIIN